jgi:glucan endo-1,3-beta-D-glucosidase
MPEMAPVHIRSPGGISVFHIANQVLNNVSTQNVGNSSIVGVVPLIESARQYNIASFPCEAGQKVGYQVDSVGGLEADWLQMTYPALGLFMMVK